MPNPVGRTPISDVELRRFAFLYSRHAQTKTRKEIFASLGLARTWGFELRKRAIEKGYLTKAGEIVAERFPPDELSRLEEEWQDLQLSESYQTEFMKIGIHEPPQILFRSTGFPVGHWDKAGRIGIFARRAAPLVWELLHRSSADRRSKELICGIAFGSTIRALVQELCILANTRPRRGGRTFFPLRGDAFEAPSEESASTLASKLNTAFSGESAQVPSLAGMPAVVPGPASPDEAERWKARFAHLDAFARIFNEDNGLAVRATAVLTSVGPIQAINQITKQCNSVGNLTPTFVKEYLAGEIAGIPLLKQTPLAGPAATNYEVIAARWIGFKEKHLTEIIRLKRKPGVIVVACGAHPEKAECIYHLCRRGWCNVLVVDELIVDVIQVGALYESKRRSSHFQTNLAEQARAVVPKASPVGKEKC